MKNYFILSILFLSTLSFGQKLNAYKYAIVPEKFAFQTENNQYNFNELVKSAMRRYGFEPFYNSEELPVDVTDTNKLYVDLIDGGNLIYTKLNLVFKDYRNNIIFSTQDGKSKEKEVAAAYNEAFRETVKSVELMNHHYSENIDEENFDANADKNLKIENDKISSFTAVTIKNGYDLSVKNQTSFVLKSTSKTDVYLATKDQITGLVYKTDSKWFFEYYKKDELIQEKIEITFKN